MTPEKKKRATAAGATLRGNRADSLSELRETNRQLKRKIFDLYTVFDISRNINSLLQYDALLDNFILTCLGQMSATRGCLLLADGPDDPFRIVRSKGDDGEKPSSELSAQSRLVELVTRLSHPRVIDLQLMELVEPDERLLMEQYESGVIIPLVFKGSLTGLLLISPKISGSKFSADDLEFLSVLANQIAVAIENATRYERELQATRLLRQAQEQLVQSEKLAALGEMSARVAHEVNNPLGIIKNYLLLIRKSSDRQPQTQMYTEVVSQEIDRIARIVRQLLDFHRPQAAILSRLDLNQTVAEIEALMQKPLASSDIRLTVKLAEAPLFVRASSDSLKQVFLNVLVNARDAMTTGGSLEIRVSQEGTQALVEFEDSGPGIAPDLIPKIFEPFFTTKESTKGTGLGLSVCYGIMKTHNGSISFRNTETGGCFTVQLPLMPEESRRIDG